MTIETLDPLLDPRWDKLVSSHPHASVFHTTGWLKALAKTYGYRPVALTSTGTSEHISDGVVFCEVRSRFTGARLISLPFSDHAQPLLNGGYGFVEMKRWMETACSRGQWKYFELRPNICETDPGSHLVTTESFWLHTLDLAPSIGKLFSNLHKSCIQRRIRHAEIRIVRKDGVPVAGILSLRHRGTVVYKYGSSDERFHRLGGMPYLFWRLIEESKLEDVEQIDFGRTELENAGLIEFKERIGAIRTKMSYLRYPQSEKTSGVQLSRLGLQRKLLSFLPDFISSNMGRLVYRHLA